MAIHNVHERHLHAAASDAGALLDRLSSPHDPLWPDSFEPMRFDRPLQPGARGGHGPVHYTVESWTPGERVVFRFDPSTGFLGTHMLEVLPSPSRDDGCIMRHTISAKVRSQMRILWPLAVRWLHDECLEDLLDRAETNLTGNAATHRRNSWVTLIFRPGRKRFLDAAVEERKRRDAGEFLAHSQ